MMENTQKLSKIIEKSGIDVIVPSDMPASMCFQNNKNLMKYSSTGILE